jgi:hypothetical protein
MSSQLVLNEFHNMQTSMVNFSIWCVEVLAMSQPKLGTCIYSDLACQIKFRFERHNRANMAVRREFVELHGAS